MELLYLVDQFGLLFDLNSEEPSGYLTQLLTLRALPWEAAPQCEISWLSSGLKEGKCNPCSSESFGLDLKYAHVLADQSSPLWTGRFAPFSSLTHHGSNIAEEGFHIVLIGLSVNCVCALLVLKFGFFTLSTAFASEIWSSSSDNNIAKRKVGQEVCR